MKQLKRIWVWLRRIRHCRGFGIQSPNDYSFVRYVINEHYPYYAYSEVGNNDDWLTQKLGRLYLRLANWRQPDTIVDPSHSPYWQAGCHKARILPVVSYTATSSQSPPKVELCKWSVTDDDAQDVLQQALDHTDQRSVIVVEHIYRNRNLWQSLSADSRITISYDLYYCGILLFENRPFKQSYIINF